MADHYETMEIEYPPNNRNLQIEINPVSTYSTEHHKLAPTRVYRTVTVLIDRGDLVLFMAVGKQARETGGFC